MHVTHSHDNETTPANSEQTTLEPKASEAELETQKQILTALSPVAPEQDPNLVVFTANDPGNPQNWSKKRRWIITVNMGIISAIVTLASSIFSTATEATAKEFHVSTTVTTLGTSLFVLVGAQPLCPLEITFSLYQQLIPSRVSHSAPSSLVLSQKSTVVSDPYSQAASSLPSSRSRSLSLRTCKRSSYAAS